MRLTIRLLMFLACLLYGAMPAQMAMGMPGSSQPAISREVAHSNLAAGRELSALSLRQDAVEVGKNDTGDCCPHGGDAAHPGSCAACLIVVPQTVFADAGRMIFSYPKPQRGTVFNDRAFAPPLPPPRA